MPKVQEVVKFKVGDYVEVSSIALAKYYNDGRTRQIDTIDIVPIKGQVVGYTYMLSGECRNDYEYERSFRTKESHRVVLVRIGVSNVPLKAFESDVNLCECIEGGLPWRTKRPSIKYPFSR